MLITYEEAARRLDVHVATLRAWVREGKVPSYRLGKRFGRIDWHELLAALSDQRRAEQQRDTTQEAAP